MGWLFTLGPESAIQRELTLREAMRMKIVRQANSVRLRALRDRSRTLQIVIAHAGTEAFSVRTMTEFAGS
jgi:hypothetical protein